eukprot:CAMPEP_0198154632 /NCGR_PEP_ID=MMETSP1443-20131203/68699_1 /TAXON_ID=186043 /ORGANISM="Entomoneis sp., Strain CCMP2396" /LENGTH=436 /DNA_ID=CAMNT_0043821319 /DNA_START=152 /DNA_END=1462 /DNA_ORIENTATION=+
MDDRTSEFQALARSLPGADVRRGSPGSGVLPSSSMKNASASPKSGEMGAAAKNNPAYAELRSFQLTAGGISKDIAGTSALLTELTSIVRNQSIITDDSETQRMNSLVVRIKSAIENLNSRLDIAGNTINQQKRRLGKNSQVGQQASNLVDELKSEFAAAASGFKKVLQLRTDTMKETDILQKQVYGKGAGGNGEDNDDDDAENPMPNMSWAPPPVYGNNDSAQAGGGGGGGGGDMGGFPTLDLTSGMMSPGQGGGGGGGGGDMGGFPTLDLTSGMMSPGQDTSSGLPRPHGIAYSYGNMETPYQSAFNSFADPDEMSDRVPLTPLDIQRMEEESGLQMQLIPDQEYLQNRAEAMSEVEANIVELGTIFNKLAGLVSEHREMVQRVEDNVDDANTNVSLSMEVLTDTLTSLKTNKKLAFRLFSILTLFIIAFIIFFA